jgi:hypothetical protein
MARSRLLQPAFFTNELLSGLPPLARLLFAGLWTIADRDGRLEDRPARIQIQVFPYEPDIDVDALLDLLYDAAFIVRYQVDSEDYIEVVKWAKHQRPHPRETVSAIPPCSQQARRKQSRTQGKPRLPVSNSVSNSTSVSNSVSNSVSGRGSRLNVSPDLRVEVRQSAETRGSRLPDGWTLPAEWAAWATTTCGLTPPQVREIAASFADYWHAEAGAKARKRDWFATWRNWCRRERPARRRTSRAGGAHDGVPLTALDSTALDALARELGVPPARPGESMQAFIGRIQVAQNRRGLH